MNDDQTVEMKPVKPEYLRIGIAIMIAVMYVSSIVQSNLHGLWLSTLALTLFTTYHCIEYYFEKNDKGDLTNG